MAILYYLAWCDEATSFSPAMHVEDEQISAIDLGQAEGGFASLSIDVVNPRLGLLGPGRNQWCWFSWKNGAAAVEALFHGRLVGVPQNLTDEVVRLQFVARPSDYPEQKAALADTLKEDPRYWDPLWIQEGIDDPDTAWEARAELVHIDRVTLAVTSSSIIAGEDGTIDISADEHFYDGVGVTYGPQPKRRIGVKLTGTWVQRSAGEVDMTRRLVTEFQAHGSPYQWPMVSSYTADGLVSDWPKPLADLGGGWSMAANSSAVAAEFVPSSTYPVRYTDKSDATTVLGHETERFNQPLTPKEVFFINWKNFEVIFEIAPVVADLRLAYAAERKRSEVVNFTVAADIQSILTDPGAAEEESIELSTTFIDQPVDPDEALPIGDLRRNLFFPTDRGAQAIEYGMMIAVSRLLAGARAVDIKFASTWAKLASISCRKSVTLHDPRLPGGVATGKVKSYRLAADGQGQVTAEATIGCMIGYGVALEEAAEGDDVYATGYSTGYTQRTGGEIAVIPGQVHYESLDGTYVIDDDGVDLFNMTARTAVNSLTVTDGPTEQRWAIDGSLSAAPADLTLTTTGEIVNENNIASIANLASVEGLVSGTSYNIGGPGIPNPFTMINTLGTWSTGPRMMMIFNGTDGGALRLTGQGDTDANIPAVAGTTLLISAISGAVLTPDPLAALELHPTVVALDLVPVTGGDFLTEYDVVVLPIVVPQGINLEAA